jgi:hypothetical protein
MLSKRFTIVVFLLVVIISGVAAAPTPDIAPIVPIIVAIGAAVKAARGAGAGGRNAATKNDNSVAAIHEAGNQAADRSTRKKPEKGKESTEKSG